MRMLLLMRPWWWRMTLVLLVRRRLLSLEWRRTQKKVWICWELNFVPRSDPRESLRQLLVALSLNQSECVLHRSLPRKSKSLQCPCPPSVSDPSAPVARSGGNVTLEPDRKPAKEKKTISSRSNPTSFMDETFERTEGDLKKKKKKKKSKKSRKHKKKSKKARSASSESASSSVADRKKRRHKQKRSSSSDSSSSVGSSVFREASVDLKGRDWASMKARAERYPGRMAMYLLQSFGNQVGRDGVPHRWGRRETPACAQAYYNRVIAGQGVGCFPPVQKRDRREAQTLCLMFDLFATGRSLGWMPFLEKEKTNLCAVFVPLPGLFAWRLGVCFAPARVQLPSLVCSFCCGCSVTAVLLVWSWLLLV